MMSDLMNEYKEFIHNFDSIVCVKTDLYICSYIDGQGWSAEFSPTIAIGAFIVVLVWAVFSKNDVFWRSAVLFAAPPLIGLISADPFIVLAVLSTIVLGFIFMACTVGFKKLDERKNQD